LQCTKVIDIHDDLVQLSYGKVSVRSYGRYDVNGFHFRSAKFEASRPLAATVNSGVMSRAISAQGHETNYYGIIQDILEFSFAGNKKLKVVFFFCDWFDPVNGVRKNKYGMVEVKHSQRMWGHDHFILAHQVEQVYYLSYPCEKLDAWWVVHKVNSRERLFTPSFGGYEFNDDQADEVYQEEELPSSFVIEPGAGLNSLVGDSNDITIVAKRKQGPKKKKVTRQTLGWRRQLDREADEF